MSRLLLQSENGADEVGKIVEIRRPLSSMTKQSTPQEERSGRDDEDGRTRGCERTEGRVWLIVT